MKKSKMRIRFQIYCILLVIMFSCKYNSKEIFLVSECITEAKNKNVLVDTYDIKRCNIDIADTIFPVYEVWSEKTWQITNDKHGDQKVIVFDKEPYNIIFNLKRSNKIISAENFYNGIWIAEIDNMDYPFSSINGVFTFKIVNNKKIDSCRISIFKLDNPYKINGKKQKLYSFDIIKKPTGSPVR